MDPTKFAEIQLITTIVVMLANVLLVVLTAAYVLLTRQTVLEMKASREPSVYVDLEFPDMEVRAAIGNSGQSAALNIKFRVEDGVPWLGQKGFPKGLLSLEPIRDGISYLPPGRTLKYMLNMVDWKLLTEENALLKIGVNYENESGRKFKREYFIDVSQYNGVLCETYRDSNIEVAKAIRDTERSRKSSLNNSSMFRMIPPGHKGCPMCAEFIPVGAKKCSHCGEMLEGEANGTKSAKKKVRNKKN
jgi:predicted nucleic acid-binding Zn ribbon protein